MIGTNWSNVSTFPDMIIQANSNSPFWSMMLFMIWAVLVITFVPFGFDVALVAGSFLAGLIGLFLVYMGVVAWEWVAGLFALAILIFILETFFKRKEN